MTGEPLAVALVGFGTVGRSVARLLVERQHPELRLSCICTRTLARTDVGWLPAEVQRTTDLSAALASRIDVVVELIGGLSPAGTLVSDALSAGKSVVTANKQLIAHQGGPLLATARRYRRQLRFEAAVGGGIPVIRAIQEGLAGDRLQRVIGVLNGTCTYVLSRMEEDGIPYEDALAEAQSLGLAEADPSADVDGFDSRAKLSILAAIALNRLVSPSLIRTDSIVPLEPGDFDAARALGCTLRQLAWVESGGTRSPLAAGVGPALVANSSPLAHARGAQNVVVVTGRRGGATVLSGTGAGGDATAVAVMSDLLSVARIPGAQTGRWPQDGQEALTVDLPARHYLRAPLGFRVTIPNTLQAHGLATRLVVSQGRCRDTAACDSWIVDSCTRARLDSALDRLGLDSRTRRTILALPYFTQAQLDSSSGQLHRESGPLAPPARPEGALHV